MVFYIYSRLGYIIVLNHLAFDCLIDLGTGDEFVNWPENIFLGWELWIACTVQLSFFPYGTKMFHLSVGNLQVLTKIELRVFKKIFLARSI